MKAARFLFVALLGTFILGFGASVTGAAAAPAPSCLGYPPSGGAMLSVSTTDPAPGETITVAGTNFAPDVALTVGLGLRAPQALAHATTDAHGAFSTQLTIPLDATGSYTISTSAGASSAGCPTSPITISVQSTTSPGSGHHLGSTGVDILVGLAIAIALIGSGLLFTRVGRRNRRSGSHAARH